jgi:hypothetical protein
MPSSIDTLSLKHCILFFLVEHKMKAAIILLFAAAALAEEAKVKSFLD